MGKVRRRYWWKPMRRLFLTCLLAGLLVPATALAARLAPGDGTLAVRNASGDPGQLVVALSINGAAIGQVDRGRVVVLPGNGPEPDVTGATRQIDRADGSTVYVGSGIRFRAVAGYFRVRIFGAGIDINAVGQGSVRLFGSSITTGAGKYSLNGGGWTSLPSVATTLSIGT
jgi:hypothetical protein